MLANHSGLFFKWSAKNSLTKLLGAHQLKKSKNKSLRIKWKQDDFANQYHHEFFNNPPNLAPHTIVNRKIETAIADFEKKTNEALSLGSPELLIKKFTEAFQLFDALNPGRSNFLSFLDRNERTKQAYYSMTGKAITNLHQVLNSKKFAVVLPKLLIENSKVLPNLLELLQLAYSLLDEQHLKFSFLSECLNLDIDGLELELPSLFYIKNEAEVLLSESVEYLKKKQFNIVDCRLVLNLFDYMMRQRLIDNIHFVGPIDLISSLYPHLNWKDRVRFLGILLCSVRTTQCQQARALSQLATTLNKLSETPPIEYFVSEDVLGKKVKANYLDFPALIALKNKTQLFMSLVQKELISILTLHREEIAKGDSDVDFNFLIFYLNRYYSPNDKNDFDQKILKCFTAPGLQIKDPVLALALVLFAKNSRDFEAWRPVYDFLESQAIENSKSLPSRLDTATLGMIWNLIPFLPEPSKVNLSYLSKKEEFRILKDSFYMSLFDATLPFGVKLPSKAVCQIVEIITPRCFNRISDDQKKSLMKIMENAILALQESQCSYLQKLVYHYVLLWNSLSPSVELDRKLNFLRAFDIKLDFEGRIKYNELISSGIKLAADKIKTSESYISQKKMTQLRDMSLNSFLIIS